MSSRRHAGECTRNGADRTPTSPTENTISIAITRYPGSRRLRAAYAGITGGPVRGSSHCLKRFSCLVLPSERKSGAHGFGQRLSRGRGVAHLLSCNAKMVLNARRLGKLRGALLNEREGPAVFLTTVQYPPERVGHMRIARRDVRREASVAERVIR